MNRLLRYSIQSVQSLILIALIASAAYVSMGRLLVANLNAVSGSIQQLLSDSLQVPLTYSNLSGDWRYMDPVFYLSDVQVAEAATIREVEVRVDTLSSLMTGKLVFSDLLVDGVWARVIVTDSGQLIMPGLKSSGDAGIAAEPIYHTLEHLVNLSLRNVRLEIVHRDVRHQISITGDDEAEIYRLGDTKIIRIPLTFSNGSHEGRTLLMAEYSGSVRTASDVRGKAYFQIQDLQIPEMQIAEFQVAPMYVDGRFWLSQDDDGLSLVGEPVVRDVTITLGSTQLKTIDRSSFMMHGLGRDITDMSLELPLVDIDVSDRTWHAEQLGLAWRKNRLAGVVPQISIDDVIDLTNAVSTLPTGVVDLLEQVRPRGQLQDVHFLVPLDEVADSRSAFRLSSVSSGSYRGMPGFSGISGFADIGLQDGKVHLNEENVVVEFGELFPDSWSFDSAKGRFQYRYQQGYLQVWSGLLHAESASIRATGRLHLNLSPELENRTWGLELGLRGIPISEVPLYVPDTVDPQASKWLATALTAGVATESGIVFHGAIAKPVPKIRKSHDLFVRVSDVAMTYEPEWPPLSDIEAEVHISTRGVRSKNATARMYDDTIVTGNAFMPLQYAQPAKAVLVSGEFTAPVKEGIRLINESPLSKLTREATAGWDGNGSINGSLELTVPLVPDRDELMANIKVNLDAIDLEMSSWDLIASNLIGEARYHTDEGLAATDLRGELLGMPARIDITTDDDLMIVNAEGNVDMVALYEWTGQSLLTQLSGVSAYQASVYVPLLEGGAGGEKDAIYIEATSNLSGVTIDMPSPMAKTQDGQVSFRYRQEFGEQHDYIDFSLGENVRAWIQSTDGAVTGGHLVFGANEISSISYDNFKVTGSLATADYDEWKSFTTALDEVSEYALENELVSVLQSIDLNIGVLTGIGHDMAEVHTVIGRGPGRWMVHLSNHELAGLVEVPDDESERLMINLDFMRYQSEQVDDDSWADPLAGVTAEDFVPLRFETGNLSYDGEDFGRWSFDLNPVDGAIEFSNVRAELRGMSVQEGAKISWLPGGPGTSRFEGEILVANLAETLEAWGYAASIEGHEFMFKTDLSWSGSPTMIDTLNVDGDVALTSGHGRFVQAESAEALKLLGIFDFTSLARRFRLDFSEVVSDGMSFSGIGGVTRVDDGHVQIVEPIVIDASGSTFMVGGSVDLHSETLDNDMIVTLPLSKNLPWYAAYSTIATGPIAGAGVLLFQQIFSDQLDTISSSKFRITGTIDEPIVEFDSIFDRRVRQGESESDNEDANEGENGGPSTHTPSEAIRMPGEAGGRTE